MRPLTNSTMHEERRGRERQEMPSIALELGGHFFHSANWSMGGALIDGYDGPLTPGALIEIRELARLEGGEGSPVAVAIRARVSRSDVVEGWLAVQFLELDRRAYDLLSLIEEETEETGMVRRSGSLHAAPSPRSPHPVLRGREEWPPMRSPKAAVIPADP